MALFLSASAANGPLSGTLIQGFTDAEHSGGTFSPDGTKIGVLSRRVNDAGGLNPVNGVDIYTSSSIGWTVTDYISQLDLAPDLGSFEFHWMEWYSNSEIYLRNNSNIYRVVSGSGGWSVSSDSPIGGSGFANSGVRFKFNPSKTKILNYGGVNRFGISESGSGGWGNFSAYTPSGLSGNSNARVRSAVWVSDTEVAVGIPTSVNGNEADSMVSVFSSSSASGFTETDSITNTSGLHLGAALYYHDKAPEYKFLVGSGRSNVDNNWLHNEGFTTRGSNWYVYKSASSTGYFGSTVRTIATNLLTPVGSNLEVDPNDSDRFIVPSLNTGSIGGLGNAGSEIYAFEYTFVNSNWNQNWYVSTIYTGSSHDASAGGRIGFSKDGEILVNHLHSNTDDMVMLFADGRGFSNPCSAEYDVCHQVRTDTRIIEHITASNAGATSHSDRKYPTGGSVSPNGCKIASYTQFRNGADGNGSFDFGIDIYTSGSGGWGLSDSFATTGQVGCIQWRTNDEIWYHGTDTSGSFNNYSALWTRSSGSSGWSAARIGAGRNNPAGYLSNLKYFVFSEQKDFIAAWSHQGSSGNQPWAIYYQGSQTLNPGEWDGVKFRRSLSPSDGYTITQIVPGPRKDGVQVLYASDTARFISSDKNRVWVFEIDLSTFAPDTSSTAYSNDGVLEHHANIATDFPWFTTHFNDTGTNINDSNYVNVNASSAGQNSLWGGLLYWHSASDTVIIGQSAGSIDTSTNEGDSVDSIDFFSPRIENKLYQYSSSSSGYFSNRTEILPEVEKHRMDNAQVLPAWDDKRIFFGFQDNSADNANASRRGGLSCLESGSQGWRLTYLAAPEWGSTTIGYASGTLVYNDTMDLVSMDGISPSDRNDGVFTVEQFTNLTGSCEEVTPDPSFTITPVTVSLTEGQNTTISVVLGAQPSSDVIINATLKSPAFDNRVTLANSTVTFTNANWSTPQLVQVTASSNDIDDGNVGPHADGVVFSVNNSSDAQFTGLSDQNVQLTVTDDDTAGFTFVSADPFTLKEGDPDGNNGDSGSFTIKLNAQPTHEVHVTMSLDTLTQAVADNRLVVDPSGLVLTFDSSNWNLPQTVALTASDDNVAYSNINDAIISFTVNSDDSNYNSFDLSSENVTASLIDNDSVGFVLGTSSLTLTEGQNDTISVRLTSQPTSDVVLSASITGNLLPRSSLTNHELTFTNANWNVLQFVQVTASDDNILNGNVGPHPITFSVVDASSDDSYDPVADQEVPLTILDNETAAFRLSTGSLTLTEGENDAILISLSAQPLTNVVVTASLHSDFDGRAIIENHVITFTPATWNVSQSLQVTASSNSTVDGNVGFSPITFSTRDAESDDSFDGISQTVDFKVLDDDASFSLSSSPDPLSVLEGSTGTVTVTINPEAPVGTDIVINASLAGTDLDGRATIDASKTFTNGGGTTQNFTFSALADDFDNDDVTGKITFSVNSGPPEFTALASQEIDGTVQDNDTAGLVSLTSSLSLTEGQSDTIDVQLTARPTQDVTVTVSLHADHASRATLTNNVLTFQNNGSWNSVQQVTVEAVDNAIIDGDITRDLTFAITSNDTKFNALADETVPLTIKDNDTPSIVISKTALTLDEGTSGDILVNLGVQPVGDVVVSATLHADHLSRATLVNNTMTFSAGTWTTPQKLTVQALADQVDNSPDALTRDITFAVVSSTNSLYDGAANKQCALTINDLDQKEIEVDPPRLGSLVANGDVVVTEAGGEDSIDISLGAEPTSNVTLTISYPDTTEFDVIQPANGTTLVFTSGDFSTPKTIVFKGKPDSVVDPSTTVTVTLTAASSDSAYDGLTATFDVRCIEIQIPDAASSPCNLLSTDYTINYYTCALGQYNYHKTLPFRLGAAMNASNIREQSSENSHKTFLGEPKT